MIKDLLNKVSKPQEPTPEVKALRDKLAKLQQRGAAPKKEQPRPQPTKPVQQPEDEVSKLTKASEEEQRRFAQARDPALKLKEERTHKLVAKQVAEMIELSTELNKRLAKLEQEKQASEHKLEEIEKRNEEMQEKMDVIDQRLEKFMGLYEVVTNQYNPFADVKKGDKPPGTVPEGGKPANVQVSDNLTGKREAVPIKQGEMSSENAKKIERLLAELEHDEQEKRDLGEDAAANIEGRERKTQQDVVAQMHLLLGDFEGRLKQYLDDSVQKKLHSAFSELETVLNKEIGEAVKEEVTKLKGTDDIIAGALQEMEQLSKQANTPDEYQKEEKQVEQQVRHLDDSIKAIPPSLYFRLNDGSILKSREDLVKALQSMDDAVFRHHVSGERNDFADWLELALNDTSGKDLRGKSKDEMVKALQQ